MEEIFDEKDLILIRGDRIIQQMLSEETLPDLRQNIQWGFPNTRKRQYATDPIVIVELTYKPWQKSTKLLVQGVAKSENKLYDTKILFQQIKFKSKDAPDNVTFVAVDGREYHIIPIPLTHNQVKVRCNCLDFYYRFAFWNRRFDALYGRTPPPYKRKTTTRPPVNPNRVPGICKHLIKTVAALQDAGVLADRL